MLEKTEIGLDDLNQFILSTKMMIEALDAKGLIGIEVVRSTEPSEAFVNRITNMVGEEIEELENVWGRILIENPRYLDVGFFWLTDASFILKAMNSPTWRQEASRFLSNPEAVKDLKEISTWITIFIMSSIDLFIWGYVFWRALRNPNTAPEERKEIGVTVWNSCAATILSMRRLEFFLRRKLEEATQKSVEELIDKEQEKEEDELVN